ncbi:MAG TPA: GGDEF domain-containing protein [Miltoncostaea sp.]|nr:GGDEF domain-containing protein [Miltoncostaea sp.]
MGLPRRIEGERGRHEWFQLEDRHTGVLIGRLTAAAAMAAIAVLAPPEGRTLALVACVGAVALQLALWLLPRRYGRRLRLAVDVSLIVDAAWATALAHAWGGPYATMTGLFLITGLSAALGYSARTGLKAAILGTLGFLVLVWYADEGRLWSAEAMGRIGLFWGVLVAAIIAAATNERWLAQQRDRATALHEAARTLLDAQDPEAMREATAAAAARVASGWRATVRMGSAPDELRLVRAGREGVVVVPVTVAGTVVGALECRRPLARGRRVHRIRVAVIQGLETLAAELGSALWRADLLEREKMQALTDGLTGLATRRAFDLEMTRRLEESRRLERPLSLCLMDIDHFKSFNDTFGHQAGDETLQAVAAAIAGACRTSDVPARYGGEEMALLLPGGATEDALEVAERIRLAVAAIPLETRQVTVSIGVSTTDGTCSAELLIEAADRALYASKEAGRNRVTAEPTTVTAASSS